MGSYMYVGRDEEDVNEYGPYCNILVRLQRKEVNTDPSAEADINGCMKVKEVLMQLN